MKRAATLLAALLLTLAAAAQGPPREQRLQQEAEAERKLDEVRGQIRGLTEQQHARAAERDAASAALREADAAVDREMRSLREIEAGIATQQAELVRLEAEKSALEARLATQRDALAELIRSAYALGRNEKLKLLLAQDRVDRLARVLAYHRYFERDRVVRIERLLGELRELAVLGEAVTAQRTALDLARAEQQQRVDTLELQRGERRTFVARLDAAHRDAQARLAALERDERALLQLLESLRDVFADIPPQIEDAQPFARRRGALPQPLGGEVLSRYGGAMPDGRRSQGWLIAGEAGATVTAVAPGRVAFADWLKGYGLLLILDHGDGYMSLYAYNDSLLKQAGDWVARGEALAGVGSSGGQSRAALYFEIRHRGRPVDPAVWLAGGRRR